MFAGWCRGTQRLRRCRAVMTLRVSSVTMLERGHHERNAGVGMKIAFHFNADDQSLTDDYGTPIVRRVFRSLLGRRGLRIDSRILLGDLRLHELTISRTNMILSGYRLVPEITRTLATQMLLDSRNSSYCTLTRKSAQTILTHNIFVVYLKNVNFWQTKHLDNHLRRFQSYIGALEINDNDPLHICLYRHQLIESYHIKGRRLDIIADSDDDEEISGSVIFRLMRLGFDSVRIKHVLTY